MNLTVKSNELPEGISELEGWTIAKASSNPSPPIFTGSLPFKISFPTPVFLRVKAISLVPLRTVSPSVTVSCLGTVLPFDSTTIFEIKLMSDRGFLLLSLPLSTTTVLLVKMKGPSRGMVINSSVLQTMPISLRVKVI